MAYTPLMRHVCSLVCMLMLAGGYALSAAHAGSARANAFAGSTQMIVVTTSNWDAVEGRLQRFERATAHGSWRPVGEAIPIVVGRKGLAWGIGRIAADVPRIRAESEPEKREGDGRAPAGVFDLGTAFGYAAEPLPGLKLPYLTLTPSIECVDDGGSKYYNRIVDHLAVAPDWTSSEHMRYTGESYHWGIVVDFNGAVTGRNRSAPVPGGGSCVFLHIWHSREQGTAGCTAMPQVHLETLMGWLDSARKPLLVQLPEPAYRRLAAQWRLPELSDDAPVR
jgi:L,D-peptidoglycan transpeptidase YkuD (ErfK/YbiS/YcfS/YnhG family)